MRGVAADLALVVGAGAVSAGLIVLLKPWLQRYALARPNARSSHTVPTPQGAGIAVVAAALGGLMAFWMAGGAAVSGFQLLAVMLAVLGLAIVGLIDDIKPLSPGLRLCAQAMAASGLLLALPDGARALPWVPYAVEVLVCLVGLVWFVNLTNFMDGIDGMTVAGIVPPLAGVLALGGIGPHETGLDAPLALALIGALLGFLPFNWHVARVFLGDVGSLAIGGMAGYLLLSFASSGQLIAALILPLYFLADTGVTLFSRWQRGERLSEAHRSHVYQRAMAAGLTVPAIIGQVWILNLQLLALALVAGTTLLLWLQVLCLGGAIAVTAVALRRLARGRAAGT
jgi:UDP-N-acetylmuramyl pentapeptide phosphotransferase/UDP-N-acetylglucosamine-1-phosphate transferase